MEKEAGDTLFKLSHEDCGQFHMSQNNVYFVAELLQ